MIQHGNTNYTALPENWFVSKLSIVPYTRHRKSVCSSCSDPHFPGLFQQHSSTNHACCCRCDTKNPPRQQSQNQSPPMIRVLRFPLVVLVLRLVPRSSITSSDTTSTMIDCCATAVGKHNSSTFFQNVLDNLGHHLRWRN